jgi:hypothetical protein
MGTRRPRRSVHIERWQRKLAAIRKRKGDSGSAEG